LDCATAARALYLDIYFIKFLLAAKGKNDREFSLSFFLYGLMLLAKGV